MDRSELRQMVRDIVMVQDHEVADTLIDQFLMEGYQKILVRSKWAWLLQAAAQISVPTVPFDLTTLPTTGALIAIYDIAPPRDTQRLPLTQITRSEATFFLNTRPFWTKSRFYWVEGDNLFIDPAPDPSDTFTVSYYADPTWPTGDSEVPPFPEWFHSSTLVNYAAHRVWERQEDFDRSDAYLGRFEMGVSDMTIFENTQNMDRPKIFGELVGSRGRARNMPWLDGV